jgi:hypothetical protein
MTPARQLLTQFVLEQSINEPLQLRMLLYRALAAELPGRSPEFRQFTSLADELEAIEARHQQLLLDLRARGGVR